MVGPGAASRSRRLRGGVGAFGYERGEEVPDVDHPAEFERHVDAGVAGAPGEARRIVAQISVSDMDEQRNPAKPRTGRRQRVPGSLR